MVIKLVSFTNALLKATNNVFTSDGLASCHLTRLRGGVRDCSTVTMGMPMVRRGLGGGDHEVMGLRGRMDDARCVGVGWWGPP